MLTAFSASITLNIFFTFSTFQNNLYPKKEEKPPQERDLLSGLLAQLHFGPVWRVCLEEIVMRIFSVLLRQGKDVLLFETIIMQKINMFNALIAHGPTNGPTKCPSFLPQSKMVRYYFLLPFLQNSPRSSLTSIGHNKHLQIINLMDWQRWGLTILVQLIQAFIIAKMQDDPQAVLTLIQRLSTNQALPAWDELVQLCRSEGAMNQVRLILSSPSVQDSTRLVAASVAGRLLVKHAREYSQGYGEKYLLAVMTDLSLSFQIKKMVGDCLTHHLRYSPSFLNRLMVICEEMATSIQSNQEKIKPVGLLKMKKSELEQLIANFTQLLRFDFAKEENWLSACQTIILIGQAIVRLIFTDSSETKKQKQKRKTPKQQGDFSASVMRLMKCLKVYHMHIVNEANIQKHPELLQKLFKLYQHLTDDETQVDPARKCLMEMADWYFLPASIFQICRFDIALGRKGKKITEKTLSLRCTASYFFAMLIGELKETQCRVYIKDMLEMFIQPSKNVLSTTDTSKNDSFYEHALHFVCLYHLERTDIPIEEMMDDFQQIIAPSLTKLLIKDRFDLFVDSPAQLYTKLSEILQGDGHDGILEILSHVLTHFTLSSINFFIYLFQAFRLSLQDRLKCDSCQKWDIPDYLQNSKPLEIITVFYIMAIIPYNNQLATGVFDFLKVLITPQFVNQLDYLDISLFYFFLETAWLQIYEDNEQEGLFLLTHIFKEEINPSAKYFLYEFVNRLSDYFVNEGYILTYVQQLPLLYPHDSRWDNVLKWVTYLQDFEQGFTEKFVIIIKRHIGNQINLSLENKLQAHEHHEQLRNYLKILIHIASQEKIMKESHKLQVMILEEYSHFQSFRHAGIEDCLYQILAYLCKLFKFHHEFYSRILPDLLERHASLWGKPIKNFYFLLAEYIFHTEDSLSIMHIYRHFNEIVGQIDLMGEKVESKRYKLLLILANVLIIFQNLLLKHAKILGDDCIENIAAKAIAIENMLSANQQKLTHKRQTSIVMARCVNIQLSIFAILNCVDISFHKCIQHIRNGIFGYYDTQCLVAILERLNSHSFQQKRSTILFLISLIMVNQSDRQEEKNVVYELFYDLPNRMTPVFTKTSSVFRQIKKFMIFYHIPDWNRMSELTTGFPPQFFLRFKDFFDLMMKKDAKQLKKRGKEDIMVMDEGEPVHARKRRANDFNCDDQEQGKKTMRRRMAHENFTKRVKRDAQMLPRKTIENGCQEKDEYAIDFNSKQIAGFSKCDHSSKVLQILTANFAFQQEITSEQSEYQHKS